MRALTSTIVLLAFAAVSSACDESSSGGGADGTSGSSGNGSSSGGTQNPAGTIVNGPQQGLYVTDSAGALFHLSLEDGAVLAKHGTRGSGQLQFDDPVGIAATKKHLYVADRGNRRIVRMTVASGAGWKEIALGDTGEPYGIAASLSADESEETVLFADYALGQFFVAPKDFTGAPSPAKKLSGGFNGCSVAVREGAAAGTTGCTSSFALNAVVNPYDGEAIYPTTAGTGELKRPDGVAYLPSGALVLADTGNFRVLCRLGGSGEFGKKGSTTDLEFESIQAIAADGRGRIFVADTVRKRIVRVDGCNGANPKVLFEGDSISGIRGLAAVGPYEGAQGQ